MAGFFNNLKKEIGKGTKVLSAKSSSAIEINKVKSEVNALKKNKIEIFTAMGKKVYEGGVEFVVAEVSEELESLKNIDITMGEKEVELERIKTETEAKLNEINTEVESVKEEEVAAAVEVEIVVEDAVKTEVEDVTKES